MPEEAERLPRVSERGEKAVTKRLSVWDMQGNISNIPK